MRAQAATRRLEVIGENAKQFDAENGSLCRGFGLCLEGYVEALKSSGQRFLDDDEPMEIICHAKTCRWNRRGRCTMDFNSDNLHSLDESGRCFDYAPR